MRWRFLPRGRHGVGLVLDDHPRAEWRHELIDLTAVHKGAILPHALVLSNEQGPHAANHAKRVFRVVEGALASPSLTSAQRTKAVEKAALE